MPGQKDGQILFHRTLLATAGGPTSTTTVDCHIKVVDIDCYVSLTKNIASHSACKKSAQFVDSFVRYIRV